MSYGGNDVTRCNQCGLHNGMHMPLCFQLKNAESKIQSLTSELSKCREENTNLNSAFIGADKAIKTRDQMMDSMTANIVNLKDQLSAYKEALERVHLAIYDKGINRGWHEEVMARHRKEWPTLWKALDALPFQPPYDREKETR